MNKYFSSLLAFCLIFPWPAWVAGQQGGAGPVVLTTVPQRARLQSAKGQTVDAQATLTLVEAHVDDTLSGLLILTIGEDQRRMLGQYWKVEWQSIPSLIARREVRARWAKGTACPELRLTLETMEVDYAGESLRVLPFSLRIQETPDNLPQLLCSWSRQINAKRPRRGIVMAINRLLMKEN